MNLHEFQAKALMKQYGVPVPRSEIAVDAETALEAMQKLGGERWVVKAQVHAGGRGLAGGVKIVDNADDLVAAVNSLIGTRLVTYQTDESGQPVNQVLVEAATDIAQELYLGAVIDRVSQCVAFMVSTEGGMNIEEVADKTPEKIVSIMVDPSIGLQPFQTRDLFFALGLDVALLREFSKMLMGLYRLFKERDLSLLEVNPLVVTSEGRLICLDGKINIDDSALYRQAELREMRDTSQENERETRAQRWELNYITLAGDIGCMVNGAGLAMATMDLIKLQGGSPANFLDVGGGATKERVAEAFKIIMSDEQVKAILVNIFGGIVRCDLIADGIIAAVAEVGVAVPVVVRLAGNNADIGLQKLKDSELNIVAASDFSEAARTVVQHVMQHEEV